MSYFGNDFHQCMYYVCPGLWTYMYVNLCICTSMCMCVFVCIIYIRMCLCMCLCVHLYTDILGGVHTSMQIALWSSMPPQRSVNLHKGLRPSRNL